MSAVLHTLFTTQVLVGMSEHDIDKLLQDKPFRVCTPRCLRVYVLRMTLSPSPHRQATARNLAYAMQLGVHATTTVSAVVAIAGAARPSKWQPMQCY